MSINSFGAYLKIGGIRLRGEQEIFREAGGRRHGTVLDNSVISRKEERRLPMVLSEGVQGFGILRPIPGRAGGLR